MSNRSSLFVDTVYHKVEVFVLQVFHLAILFGIVFIVRDMLCPTVKPKKAPAVQRYSRKRRVNTGKRQ